MGKTKEADPDLKLWTSRVKIQKKNQFTHSRNSGRGSGRKLTSNLIFKIFIPDLVKRPTAAMVTCKTRR